MTFLTEVPGLRATVADMAISKDRDLTKRVRNALRRLRIADNGSDAAVHFHRRGSGTEVCYDPGCRIPHLSA